MDFFSALKFFIFLVPLFSKSCWLYKCVLFRARCFILFKMWHDSKFENNLIHQLTSTKINNLIKRLYHINVYK